MKKLLALALIFTLTFAIGLTAFAAVDYPDEGYIGPDYDEFENNSGETDVYLISGSEAVENLAATVPMKVVLAVTIEDEIIAPTNYEIANTGAIKFHISAIAVELIAPYTFNATAGENTLNLTLNGVTLAAPATTIDPADWNVTSGTVLNLAFAGSVGAITADITSETQVFTITYTLTAGTAV